MTTNDAQQNQARDVLLRVYAFLIELGRQDLARKQAEAAGLQAQEPAAQPGQPSAANPAPRPQEPAKDAL